MANSDGESQSLQLVNFKELVASNEERDQKEAEQLKTLWAEIELGEAELTEGASIRRNGLRLLKSDHSVELKAIEILAIEGQFALCRYKAGPYFVKELIARGEIQGMKTNTPTSAPKPPNPQYWVAD